jgi:hypothetical protein
VFIPVKPFQMNLMYVGKVRSLPLSGAPERDFIGMGASLPENIKLGWKSSPGTNTLAYYQNSLTMAVESFITLDPGKLFQPSLMFAGKAGAYLSEAPFR